MRKFLTIVFLLFSFPLISATCDDEEKIEQVLCYLGRYGIDLYNLSSYEEISTARLELIAQDIIYKNHYPLLKISPPFMTSKTEYIVATAFIVAGLSLYVPPATRPAGIRLIQIGLSIIGYNNISDFCGYLIEKGYFSNEDWNIFHTILGDVTSTNKLRVE